MVNNIKPDSTNNNAITKFRKLLESSKRFGGSDDIDSTIETIEIMLSDNKLIESNNNKTSIEQLVYDKLLPGDKQFISVVYQAERAVKEYYSAIETHSEGKAYQNLLENMFYLNDDFNDRLLHFRLAQERYRINSGRIGNNIVHSKNICRNTSLYLLENYLKTQYEVNSDMQN